METDQQLAQLVKNQAPAVLALLAAFSISVFNSQKERPPCVYFALWVCFFLYYIIMCCLVFSFLIVPKKGHFGQRRHPVFTLSYVLPHSPRLASFTQSLYRNIYSQISHHGLLSQMANDYNDDDDDDDDDDVTKDEMNTVVKSHLRL